MRQFKKCGTPLSEQAKFCPNCGAPRASAPKALKADTASAATQADAQSTFAFEVEADAKNAQPYDVTLRKVKKNTKKGEKTRQPLRTAPKRMWAWFKSRRLPIKILLCVALVVVVLAMGILMNLLWDYTLYRQKLPCPNPVDYFSLIKTDGSAYTGFMDEETSLEAIRAYRILLQTKYNADVTISEENKEQHRYVLDIELYRWSLFGNVRRRLTVAYQDSDATWYIEKGWSHLGRMEFVPVEPYQAETTTSGKTTEQRNTVTVPESSSDTAGNETTAAQENETTAPTESGDDATASSSSSSGVTSGDSDWHKDVLDCLTCHGSGDCTKCDGYGFTYTYTYVDGERTRIKKSCSSCHGSMKCRTCGGSGKR